MRLGASDSVLLAGFVALAVGSIGLKAWAGPPRDGAGDVRRDEIAAELVRTLSDQGFATSVLPLHIQSSIVFAQRGGCRLSARDARGGKATMTQYAHDAAAIGPVRYWYKGLSYDSPPSLRIRVGRLESELLDRAGMADRLHVPIALATSSACGSADFGLGDISLSA
jgi:hypothetical protein